MNDSQKKEKKIAIEISKDMEGGSYFNQALIIHTNKEFMMDFGIALPDGKIKVQSRVITNPIDAKAFLHALQENIAIFEKKFGTIQMPGQEVSIPENKRKIH